MGTDPGTARELAHELAQGIDPGTRGTDALRADLARAAEAPGPPLLEAGCVRAAYEAIAAAGEHADAPDDATSVSLRVGARAAADAARVADEIGAGAGGALLTAWGGAVRHTAEAAPDPVFQTVVDAVGGVLDR